MKTATEAFDVTHRSKAISISLLKIFVEGLVLLLILESGCQFEVEVFLFSQVLLVLSVL